MPPSRNDHVSQQIRNKFGDYDSVARNIVHYPEDSISCLYDNNLKRKKNYNNNNNVVNFNVQNTNSNNIFLSQPTVKNGYDMVPVHYQSSVDNSAFVSKNTFSYKTNCNPNLNPNSNSKLCSGQKRDFAKEPNNITNEYPKLHSKPVKPLTKAPAVAVSIFPTYIAMRSKRFSDCFRIRLEISFTFYFKSEIFSKKYLILERFL